MGRPVRRPVRPCARAEVSGDRPAVRTPDRAGERQEQPLDVRGVRLRPAVRTFLERGPQVAPISAHFRPASRSRSAMTTRRKKKSPLNGVTCFPGAGARRRVRTRTRAYATRAG